MVQNKESLDDDEEPGHVEGSEVPTPFLGELVVEVKDVVDPEGLGMVEGNPKGPVNGRSVARSRVF